MRKQKKHWYYIVTYWCPLCLREDTFRERRYTRRPKRWENRHEWCEQWDHCGI